MKFDRFNDVWHAVFVNFETKIVFFFLKGVAYKKSFLWYILNSLKTRYFVVDTIEENKQKFCFKIDKKLRNKHH